MYNQGTLTITGCTLTDNQAVGGSATLESGGGGGGLGGPGTLSGGPPNPGGSNGFYGFPGGFGGGGGRGGVYPGSGSKSGSPGGAGGFGGGGGRGGAYYTGGDGGDGGFGGGGGAGGVGSYEGIRYYGREGRSGFGGGSGGSNGGAGMGGAVFNQGGTVTISNSTITGNTARGGTAGGSGFGGGLFNLNGSVALTHVTFAANTVAAGSETAGRAGGAVYSLSLSVFESVQGQSATPTQNATVTLADSILTDSTGGLDFINHQVNGTAAIIATGTNIVTSEVLSSGTVSGTPFTVADPLLGPLQDNGGFTPTMALLPGSPAIDAGVAAADLATDQRGPGFARPSGEATDIGAFEVQVTPLPPPPSPPPPPLPPPLPLPPAVPVLAGGPADGSAVRLVPSSGQLVVGELVAFFPGSVRTAVADVTGDGVLDLIGGAGPGGGPRVAVIDGATGVRVADFFAFAGTFTGGVFVAAADLDGDGKAEVVVTPDRGGGPVVAVFDGTGAQIARFFGIEDPNFRGGARPALGDLNADGIADLIVSAGFLGGPRIAIFDGRSVAAGGGGPVKLVADFFAFEPSLRNGAFVAAGDVTGDGFADLAFGGGPDVASRVRVFDGQALLAAGPFTNLDAIPTAQWANFFAGDSSLRGGVRLALRDADGDGRADLLAGSGEGEASRVRVYAAGNLLANPNPTADQELDPFGAVLADGVFVG